MMRLLLRAAPAAALGRAGKNRSLLHKLEARVGLCVHPSPAHISETGLSQPGGPEVEEEEWAGEAPVL